MKKSIRWLCTQAGSNLFCKYLNGYGGATLNRWANVEDCGFTKGPKRMPITPDISALDRREEARAQVRRRAARGCGQIQRTKLGILVPPRIVDPWAWFLQQGVVIQEEAGSPHAIVQPATRPEWTRLYFQPSQQQRFRFCLFHFLTKEGALYDLRYIHEGSRREIYTQPNQPASITNAMRISRDEQPSKKLRAILMQPAEAEIIQTVTLDMDPNKDNLYKVYPNIRPSGV